MQRGKCPWQGGVGLLADFRDPTKKANNQSPRRCGAAEGQYQQDLALFPYSHKMLFYFMYGN